MNNSAQILKLTEDETVFLLITHLEESGWTIDSKCIGHEKGTDIVAVKDEKRLLVEVKGARASDDSPIKKRPYFTNSQIKTHFGKAIVKALQDKHKNPDALIAIAQPDDADIRRILGDIVPYLKDLGIEHYWVSSCGLVDETNN